MSEATPMLMLSLALRQRQQRQENNEVDQQRGRQPPDVAPQPSQQHSPRQIVSRWRSSSPALPVIREDDHDSSNASGLTVNSPGSSIYANYNNMSSEIVWPPEDDDHNNTSWPPRNHRADEQEMANYGSFQDFIESEDYLSSPSSSTSESSDAQALEQQYYQKSSRHNRYVNVLFASIFAITLSSAAWLPLLQQQQSARQTHHSSHKHTSSYAREFFKLHQKYDREEEDDDDYYEGGPSTYPPVSWYRHRHFDGTGVVLSGGSQEGYDGNGTDSPHQIPLTANISFADLAAALLPPYFQATVDLCVSTIVPKTVTTDVVNNTSLDNYTTNANITTTSVMPGEVYALRKTMLKTRDLLDVFSPVYSTHSSLDSYWGDDTSRKHILWLWTDGEQQVELELESDAHGGRISKSKKKKKGKEEVSQTFDGEKTSEIKDLWKTLRKFLNKGYMIIGDFQDLDHAHINYNPEQLAEYQLQVWQWHEGFISFVDENRHHLSLYLSLPCKKKHPTSSTAVRCRNTHSHSSHLFWGNTTRHELPDGNIDMATSALGRLGSSQLIRSELYLRKAVTYEHIIATNDTETNGVHLIYHNLRKELRSFLDEVDLFGRLLIPGSSLVPEIETNSNITSDQDTVSEHKEQIDEALANLKRTRKLLGDLNDDYVAYTKYIEWNEYPNEQQRLHTAIEARWAYFRSWAREVELFDKIQFLVDRLREEGAAKEHSSDDFSDEMYLMPNPAYSLESFLIQRRANPTNHFVLGNDAGDADSIISAISLAYVESVYFGGQLTPIVSIPQEVFRYERPDANVILELAGIDNPSDKLLFIDDLNEMLLSDTEKGLASRSLTLVDHNTINKSFRHFQKNFIVTQIVDHHKDEKQYKETCIGKDRNIAFDHGHALVASTTTLVAERLLENSPPYPPSIGIVLLGTILLDSVNLDESVGKVTERDRDVVNALLLYTDWNKAVPSSYLKKEEDGNITVDTNELFWKIQHSKYDPVFWTSLSAKRALQYDYKDFHHHHGFDTAHLWKNQGEHFGISTILMSGIDFMNKEGFYASTLAFMKQKQIPFLGIMFAFYDEQEIFHRQLAFISIDRTDFLHGFVEALLSSTAYNSVNLQLEEAQLPGELSWRRNVRLFNQNNLTPSRKQIGPLLEDF